MRAEKTFPRRRIAALTRRSVGLLESFSKVVQQEVPFAYQRLGLAETRSSRSSSLSAQPVFEPP
jgi:hypothetical protein